jgi:ribonucleoside-diphosphate reductase alpha chain
MSTAITAKETPISYDDAFKASVEYFNGEELPAKVFLDKYALRDDKQNLLEKTPEDMHHRIAKEIHRIESKKFKNPLTYEEIFDYLKGFNKIIPQGSPMYGIGNPYLFISLSNCFVSEIPLDSYGGICHADEQFVQICKRRGGIGTDLSELRPSGTPTKNGARTSTGCIPFMRRFSNSIREVAQNGRRGASMLSMSIHHPESVILLEDGVEPTPVTIENPDGSVINTTTEFYNPDIPDFATIKYDASEVTGANVSIRLTDEFLNAVEKGETYQQRWPVDALKPSLTKEVDARKTWKKIIHAAWQRAEPGLLFWDNILRESPADCYAEDGFRTVSTNPCSEIPLSVLDSCRLLLVNLYSYVSNPFTPKAKFDYDSFYEDSKVAQRLMDDIIDLEIECINRIIKKVENDPEPFYIKKNEIDLWKKIKTACINGRRTGTGVTAVGDTLAALGVKYGSKESIEVTEKIYKTLKLAAYRSSVDMAKELGPFPVWNHEKEKENPFLLRIKEDDLKLWADMKKYGRRNIAVLTTAPAGSVSILAMTSSGIEPVFRLSYTRRKKGNPSDETFRADFVDQSGDAWQEFTVYHKKFYDFVEANRKAFEDHVRPLGYEFFDLNIPAHRTLAEKLSPWNGCCAEEIDWKQRVRLQAAAQKHVDHAISSTINLPENVSEDKVAEIYLESWKVGLKGITVYRENCRTGVLIETKEKSKSNAPEQLSKIVKTEAPDRPKELNCDIHHIRVKGQPYFVLVGLMEGEPYEVFAGPNSQPDFDKHIKKGKIVKAARGKYVLMNGENILLDSITSYLNEDQEALTRTISMSLRHGAPIAYVVHQLEKVKGDMQCFSRAKARALKHYIPDGTAIRGEECPDCKTPSLVRAEGCVQCKGCGWTRCS